MIGRRGAGGLEAACRTERRVPRRNSFRPSFSLTVCRRSWIGDCCQHPPYRSWCWRSLHSIPVSPNLISTEAVAGHLPYFLQDKILFTLLGNSWLVTGKTWICTATKSSMRWLTCFSWQFGFVCAGDSDRWVTGKWSWFPLFGGFAEVRLWGDLRYNVERGWLSDLFTTGPTNRLMQMHCEKLNKYS